MTSKRVRVPKVYPNKCMLHEVEEMCGGVWITRLSTRDALMTACEKAWRGVWSRVEPKMWPKVVRREVRDV